MPIKQKTPTPSNNSSVRKNRAGTVFKFSTILVLASFGLLYFLNVSDNQTYLIDRNFRLLTMWSQQITGKLDSYQTVVKFTAQTIPTEEEMRQSSLPYRIKSGFSATFVQGEPSKLMRKGKAAILNFLKTAREKVEADLKGLTFLKDVKVQEFLSPDLSAQVRSRAIPPLHTIHRAKTGEHQWHLQYADEDRQTQISGKIPIHPLLSEIAHQAGMVFDDVLLANPKGMIVYQRKASEFRFTNLKSLFATQVETSWLSALFSLAADGTSTSDSKTDQSQEIMSPAHLQVTPGGSSYELFVQPVLIPNLVHGEDNGEGESNTWFLCGLTSTNSFRSDYLAHSVYLSLDICVCPHHRISRAPVTQPGPDGHTGTINAV